MTHLIEKAGHFIVENQKHLSFVEGSDTTYSRLRVMFEVASVPLSY